MNGYLQRLLRTAANPAGSVHPLTSSAFARGYQGDSRFVQSGESVPSVAAMQSLKANSHDSAQSGRASASAQTSLPGPEPNSLISELLATQIASGSTQAEPSAYRGPSFGKVMVPGPFIPNAERSARDRAEETEPEMPPAKGSQRALAHREYDPLLGAGAVIKSGNAAAELEVGSLRPSAGTKDARTARNSTAADRQTDEIQIHIGRIEVTAVHPPAPRAPKARDKEISLDSYLKRRDGRAR